MADELLDAPNQQVVRADGSAPWEEGNGGATVGPKDGATDDLDSMTKAQLLDVAAERGVEVDEAMTKAEIREAIG
jgi:hypothetical protein